MLLFLKSETKDWLGRLLITSHALFHLRNCRSVPAVSSVLSVNFRYAYLFFCLKVTFKIYIKGNESTFFLLHYWICRYLIVFCNLFFLLAKSSMSCFWWIGHPYEHHESGHCLSLYLLIQWAILFSWFLKTYIQPRKHLLYIWSAVSILLIYCHDV